MVLAFFHWPNFPRGNMGTGVVSVVSFLIPENSMSYWMHRFKDKEAVFHGPNKHFENEQVIASHVPDGLDLELVAHSSAEENGVSA